MRLRYSQTCRPWSRTPALAITLMQHGTWHFAITSDSARRCPILRRSNMPTLLGNLAIQYHRSSATSSSPVYNPRQMHQALIEKGLPTCSSVAYDRCLPRGDVNNLSALMKSDGNVHASDDCGCTLFQRLFMLADDELRGCILRLAENMDRITYLSQISQPIYSADFARCSAG